MLIPVMLTVLFAADTTYYVGFLKPDPARVKLEAPVSQRIQSAHMAHIHAMADAGQLVAAGPFEDKPQSISGIFVFKTASIDEARKVANADPTVTEHRNTMDVVTWHAPAGIGEEYVRLHKADAKLAEGMGVHPLFLMQKGGNWDSPDRLASLNAHSDYWAKWKAQLGVIGSVESLDGLTEIIIFKRIPYEDAQKLIADDPAVKAGILKPEGHHWWCAEHVLPL